MRDDCLNERLRMPSCIFCGEPLGADTKPEHILLDAVGGRMTTRTVDCSACNNLFGNGIDKAFAGQSPEIRNLLQFRSGSGRTAPSLKNVKAGEQILNLGGDGKIDLVRKPFTVKENPDGTFVVDIHARSIEEIEKLIPHIAVSIKMPVEEFRKQLLASSASMIEQRPNTIPFRLSFGGIDAFRSAMKSCLVLWATLVGNDEVSGEPYCAARNFVMAGGEAFHRLRTMLDTRPIPIVDEIRAAYGPLFNLIHVQSDATGRVIGHFTLYNLIAFRVVLAEMGGTPDRRMTLVSNPEAPEVWSKGGNFDLPFDWLSAPEYNLEDVRVRLARFHAHYAESKTPDEFERMIVDVLEKNGLQQGGPVSAALAHKIGGELGLRVAMHRLGLPFEEKATLAELMRRYRKQETGPKEDPPSSGGDAED